MNERLSKRIDIEVARSDEHLASGDLRQALHHLERGHVLGQASTYQHTRIHWRMLKIAFEMRSLSEIWGQLIRIIGASTETPFGIYPTGNTGGANIWFFKSMPVQDDLQEILNQAKIK